MNYELIKFENGGVELEVNVSPEEETVWLNQAQLSQLFETTQQNVSDHIKNILKDKELDDSVHKKILYTGKDGKSYKTSFYNLDMILAVGYRIKSKRAIEFRKWASGVLKQYLLTGYVIDEKRTLVTLNNYFNLVSKVDSLEARMLNVEKNQKHLLLENVIIFENQPFTAIAVINRIIETANKSIVLIDPYVDSRTLNAFKSKDASIDLYIITSPKAKLSQLDIDLFKSEHGKLSVAIDDRNHDRFLIIDDEIVYFLGSSINYLGKRLTQIELLRDKEIIDVIRKRANENIKTS